MDVMQPETLWIGTRCYRLNQTQQITTLSRPQQYIEQNDYDSSEDEDQQQLCEFKDGRYSTSFHVPTQFFAQIIGAKGATRRRIEQETKAQITVPKQGVDGDIKITSGAGRKNVIAARRRIELIVIGGRNKLQFTHFLSIPMPDIQHTFQRFKQEIMSDKTFGINENFFQNAKKLHITISTLTLLDNEDRAAAAQYLQEFKERNYPSGLVAEIRGVEIMNDDPMATNVLYAMVDAPELQRLVDALYKLFEERGLIGGRQEQESTKMHVTLINSIFGGSAGGKDGESGGERETFNASFILDKYKDYYFGRQAVNEIHLSQRYTTASNGYYEATSIFKL